MPDSAQIDVAIRLLEFLTETYAIDTGRIYIAGNCWRPWTRWQDTQWRLYFYMSIYTGMRLAELIGLNWSDITGNMLTVRAGAAYVKRKGTIRTDRPKTQKSVRTIDLPPTVMNLLEKHCREQAEYQLGFGAEWPEAVFTGATGCRLNISSQHKNFRKL